MIAITLEIGAVADEDLLDQLGAADELAAQRSQHYRGRRGPAGPGPDRPGPRGARAARPDITGHLGGAPRGAAALSRLTPEAQRWHRDDVSPSS
jgi:hypothetical protein